MVEKITKKEFIQVMTSNRHLFLGVGRCTQLEKLPDDMNRFFREGRIPEEVTRTVVKVRSNCLEFSDSSRLYFDSFAKYTYRRNGLVYEVEIRENGNDWSKFLYYALALD